MSVVNELIISFMGGFLTIFPKYYHRRKWRRRAHNWLSRQQSLRRSRLRLRPFVGAVERYDEESDLNKVVYEESDAEELTYE